jgi:ankyrin repeat protein
MADTLSSLVGYSTDTLTLKELFRLIDTSLQCNGGYRNIIRTLFMGGLRIGLIFILQYLVKQPEQFKSWIKYLIMQVLYRKLTLSSKDNTLVKSLQTDITVTDASDPNKKSYTLYNMPMYLSTQGTYNILEYCPLVHSGYLTEKKAAIEIPDSQVVTKCCDVHRKKLVPATLFPSKNYKKLQKTIDGFFKVVNRTKMFKTQGILLDGEPGLGKSRSCDFLASLGIYGEIHYINLSLPELLKRSLVDIITDILNYKITTSVIFYFDELDKYFDFYLEHTYTEQKIEMAYSDYRRKIKQEFLYTLLWLLETSVFEAGAVFIFCSNHFETIFEDVDPKHFHSLRTRFASLKFNRCDREEFIEYIRYFNEKMVDTEFYHEPSLLEKLVIRKDLSITYRAINHCHIQAGYDIPQLIDIINGYREEPLVETSGSLIHLETKRCETPKKDCEENKPIVISEKSPIASLEDKKSDDPFDIIKKGDVGALQQLLDEGLDPNTKSKSNKSLLGYSVVENQLLCMKALLEAGANVHSCSGHENLPLNIAIYKSNLEAIEMLIEYKADPKCKNHFGQDGLSTAIELGEHHIVIRLVQLGVDPNTRCADGDTLLHKLIQNNIRNNASFERITELINLGADPHLRGRSGFTLLHTAVQRCSNLAIFKSLLTLDLDIHAVTEYDTNILHFFVCRVDNDIDLLKDLIQRGIDVNAISYKDGHSTPLINACGTRHTNYVEALLLAGADPHVKDSEGKTALDYVQTKEMRDLLLKYL